jgi:polysaccharide deacetylase family protein (PEP-CTERM system associated)
MLNVLSVDVEDYFHPSEAQFAAGPESWAQFPSRVETSTKRILELLTRHNAKATFFVLGWVAERNGKLVREIRDSGHEVACHSYGHQLVYTLTPEQFRDDTRKAMSAIEDACGESPRVYRAPSYSITEQSLWALDILAELGFTHDSSIYPIRHDRYGIPGFGRHAQRLQAGSRTILEVPPATVRLAWSSNAPVGGGGYLRLLPYRYTAAGIRRINHQEGQPACVYIHPWEFDPDQPRLISGAIGRWRTYRGLDGMHSKVGRLLGDFKFDTMSRVHPV